MIKLSDTQLVVLSAACQRRDRSIYPLTAKLSGAAAAKVLGSLITKGFLEEVEAKREDTVWREDKKRGRLTLKATPAAFKALGIGEAPPEAKADAASAPEHEPDSDDSRKDSGTTPKSRGTREGSKQAKLIAMLKRPEGATIGEIAASLDWQPHTVRGAIAHALKKKLGLEVISEKIEGRERIYRIRL
jgi:hypothetical protein